MTLETTKTEHKGFPFQYSANITKHINEVSNTRQLNNGILDKIGKEVSTKVKHVLHGDTSDGYVWFGTLYFPVDDSEVAILFPWSQDWKNKESQMDRAINVYSNKELNDEKITGLLEKLAYQMTLYVPPMRDKFTGAQVPFRT